MKSMQFEENFKRLASSFEFPETPDFANTIQWPRETGRRIGVGLRIQWGLALAVVAALLSLSLLVPQVRAKVFEIFRIGGVQILVAPETTQTAPTQPPEGITTENMIFYLDGYTTLEEARQQLDFPINLPAYPSDLGAPDYVFVQDFGTGPFVVLVWEEGRSGEVALVQYVLGPDTFIFKGPLPAIEEIEVNGNPGVWTDVPHPVDVQGQTQAYRLVVGHTLVWAQDGLTYRLEGDYPQEELLRIAESIQVNSPVEQTP